MKVSTGKVVAGKAELEGEPLPEGCVVTVLAPDGEDDFHLTDEQEAQLLLSIEQAAGGDVQPAAEVLSELSED